MMKRMPLALDVIKKKLCSAEKSSVIWAEPHSRSLAKKFGQTERSVGHYNKEWFDKELLALRNNFRVTKKFHIAKFDCSNQLILML